ncbi:glycogen synthase [Patescibacteria group bacterium]
MRVLFVTSESVPFYKRGGLGDVSHDLPIALTKLGVEVSMLMPFYAAMQVDKVECVGQLSVDWNGKRELVFVFKTDLLHGKKATNNKQSIPVYLLRHPMLNEYIGKDIDETFAFFSLAATRMYLYMPHIVGGMFDVVHCHDWHTALIPLLLGETVKTRHARKIAKTSMMKYDTLQSMSTKSVLTIHNLMYQGIASSSLIKKMGLPESVFHLYKSKKGSFIRILREGFEYADIISTVSPTYATEIVTPEFGEKLDDVLLSRRDKITGVLNGIDFDTWNPQTDKALPAKYNISTVFKVKPVVKKAVQKEVKLPVLDVPLFGFIGRIEPRQKGVDLILDALDKLDPKVPYQLVILGTGNKETVKQIQKAKKKNHHISFINAFDLGLARRIYAACDFKLVPSRFEPCGLAQLISMRYGTVPIVRKTGGLADSVVDGETGFVFEKYKGSHLAQKMAQAIDVWYESFESKTAKSSDLFRKMVKNAMKQDFSWDKSAKEYMKMYRKLVKKSS